MSVITHPRLPHLRSGPRTASVPGQRGSDELRPWSPRQPEPDSPAPRRGRGTALLLAGLVLAAAAGAGVLVAAAPWEDDAATTQAPARSVATTTDQLRDNSLSRRGPVGAGTVGAATGGGSAAVDSAAVDSVDVLREEMSIRRGLR